MNINKNNLKMNCVIGVGEKKVNFFLKKKFLLDFIKNDYLVSKLVQFLFKKGKKEKYVNILFEVFFLLKIRFGLNPILLLKLIVLRYNIPYKIVKISKGKKVFFHIRFLDFYKQLRQCVSNFLKVLISLRKKKKITFQKSLFLMVINHAVLSFKRNEYSRLNRIGRHTKLIRESYGNRKKKKSYLFQNKLKKKKKIFLRLKLKRFHYWSYLLYKFLDHTNHLKKLCIKYTHIYYMWKYLSDQIVKFTNFLCYKEIYSLISVLKKISFFLFYNLCVIRSIYKRLLLDWYRKIFIGRIVELRRMKFIHKRRVEKIQRKLGPKRIFHNDEKIFSMYGNRPKSNINMRPFFRFKEEVNRNQRIHSLYHIKYRHRVIFLRKSRFGMNDRRKNINT